MLKKGDWCRRLASAAAEPGDTCENLKELQEELTTSHQKNSANPGNQSQQMTERSNTVDSTEDHNMRWQLLGQGRGVLQLHPLQILNSTNN